MMLRPGRIWLAAMVLRVLCGSALAAEDVVFPATQSERARAVIWGATDLDAIRPVIDGFRKAHPDMAVVYRDMQTRAIYQQIREGKGAPPDLVISSAADLQVKLVNDGYALTYRSAHTERLPKWANWREQAFGFTSEPAVIVLRKGLTGQNPLPRNRYEFLALLDTQGPRVQGRIGTYDIAQSGIGYLFAAHDSLSSSIYSKLMHGLGRAGVRLYCCSGEVLDAIERGDILAGYNLLGSYAYARQRQGAPIDIVMPEDYTLVVSRVAILPKGARDTAAGAKFLDFLLSPEGQTLLVSGAMTIGTIPGRTGGPMQPIPLGPSLLVFQDELKQRRFIRDWRVLIAADP